MRQQFCSCNSGHSRHAHYDARGIFLCFACDDCATEKLSHYRPDVLTDPHYYADEPIEDER